MINFCCPIAVIIIGNKIENIVNVLFYKLLPDNEIFRS